MTDPINTAIAQYTALREQVVEEFPDLDDETLTDTLEGASDLPTMLAALMRSQLEDQGLARTLRERVRQLQARLARFEVRAVRMRELVTAAMERAGLKRLVVPEFTVSLRPARAPVVITDEAAIPERFWKPQASKLDRHGLGAALAAGESVPGAVFGNAPMTIAVRTQ